MHLVDVVLFLHIAVAIAVFVIAGILHTGQYVTRGARTVQEVRPWVGLTHRIEPVFPFLGLALFALGAWLLHLSDGEFKWSSGWVDVAIVSLVVLLGVGGTVLQPRAKKLHDAMAGAVDGPIGPELRGALGDRVTWTMSHFNSFLAAGVVFIMVTKPSGWAAALSVVIAAALGATVGSYGAAAASSPQRSAQEAPATP
jgi:hypothetical protein